MTKFSIDLETLYRETGNPLYVWSALASYEACPDGKPWPAWVTEYLRYAGEAIKMLADDEQPSVAAKRVNAVLGLTGRGRNAFDEYRLIIRAGNAAFIDEQRRSLFVHSSGKPEKAAVSKEWLAKATGVKSKRTVANWINRYRNLKAANLETK
jgi:hypothetical protein